MCVLQGICPVYCQTVEEKQSLRKHLEIFEQRLDVWGGAQLSEASQNVVRSSYNSPDGSIVVRYQDLRGDKVAKALLVREVLLTQLLVRDISV